MVFSRAPLFARAVHKFSFIAGVRGAAHSDDSYLLRDVIN